MTRSSGGEAGRAKATGCANAGFPPKIASTRMQVPSAAVSALTSITHDKYLLLLLMILILLCLGTFMDLAPLIIICTPIFLPVAKAIGIDPVHFGVILILKGGLGLITPPIGSVLFVGAAIGRPISRSRAVTAGKTKSARNSTRSWAWPARRNCWRRAGWMEDASFSRERLTLDIPRHPRKRCASGIINRCSPMW